MNFFVYYFFAIVNEEVKMNPKKITEYEREFFDSLCRRTNGKLDLEKECEIEKGFRIYSIRPRYDSYYFPKRVMKRGICLHFTMGYIRPDIEVLTRNGVHISVPYIVDRAGRIYELFDDRFYSYHLGKDAIGGNSIMSPQTIGIEISNYGCLKLAKGRLENVYGSAYCGLNETEYYEQKEFRDKKYFATMSPEQISATAVLLKYLCRKHDIPLEFKKDDALFESGDAARNFRGIFTHSNVRKDKFDWPMGKSMRSVIEECLCD